MRPEATLNFGPIICYSRCDMTPEPVNTQQQPKTTEGILEDPWFVEAAPVSEPPPASTDPELDSEWFARGRPLSDRPPAPDAEA